MGRPDAGLERRVGQGWATSVMAEAAALPDEQHQEEEQAKILAFNLLKQGLRFLTTVRSSPRSLPFSCCLLYPVISWLVHPAISLNFQCPDSAPGVFLILPACTICAGRDEIKI